MFSGGTGTKDDPFLIGSVADLEEIKVDEKNYTPYCYKQIADIDFQGADWVNPSHFYAFYDGQNYKIMNVNVIGTVYPSMFGTVLSTPEIAEMTNEGYVAMKNVRLVNVKVELDNDYSAALAGMIIPGYLIVNCHGENCTIDAPTSTNIGGLAGYVYSDSGIIDCSISGYVRGEYSSGGLFGAAGSGAKIKRNKINVELVANHYNCGGITSYCSGNIEDCEVSGTLMQPTDEITNGLGVLVGHLAGGTMKRCKSDMKVLNASRQVGLVGIMGANSHMKDCYSTGDITIVGTRFPMLVAGLSSATNDGAVIENCYYKGNIHVTTPSDGSVSETSVQVAGIATRVDEKASITGCFSAMQSLTIVSEHPEPIENFCKVGRVIAPNEGATLSNYALNTATFNGSTTFPEQDKTLEGKDGQDITISALRKKETYENEGWDFENVWDIHPDYNDGFPYLRCFGLYASTESKATIKVYDSDFKQINGDLKAVITDAYNDNITDEINGSYTMEFSTVIDGEKSQYLETGNICEVQNEYFRIVYIEETRNEDGTLTIDVQCEHVNYDLLCEDYHMEYYTADGTAFDMLVSLFEGTPFNVGDIDEEFQVAKTISSQEPLYKREALFLIAAAYQAEVRFNKFTVSLVKRRGADRGFYFAYSKNIKGVTRIVNARKRINGQPIVSYSLSAVMLEKLLGADERFETGDTVKVYDSGLGVNIETRIVKTSKDFMEEINGDVEIGNFIPDIIDSVNQIERSTVHKERLYNGIRIGPENGFEAIRSDKKARTTMNATEGIKIDLGDGEGNYEPVFYVTIEQGEAKLNLKGNAEFTGKVLASLIEASDIKGGSIEIGDNMFTVDNTGHMIANSAYIQGLIEASEFIGGKIIITNEAETERVILSVGDGFRFQAWDENAGEEGEWIDSIWMEDGKGKFMGEILSSVITGGLIRTAKDGRRIEISENQIRCYNDNGNLNGFVTDSTSGQFGDWQFYDNGNLVFSVYNAALGGGVTLRPEGNTSLFIGRDGNGLNLRGYISINGDTVSSYANETAGATYGTTEQQMLQETHNKLKQLLDAINSN